MSVWKASRGFGGKTSALGLADWAGVGTHRGRTSAGLGPTGRRCWRHVPAHLAERWDNRSIEDAQREWRTVYRGSRS